jgi:hypothetical protein
MSTRWLLGSVVARMIAPLAPWVETPDAPRVAGSQPDTLDRQRRENARPQAAIAQVTARVAALAQEKEGGSK